jgi:hypothetical protein
MKKVLLVLISVLITFSVFAQDIIVTREGKKIESKVLEINEYDIKYKNLENLDGPIYTMKKSEIATILYANGQVDVFNMSLHTAPMLQQPYNTMYYTKTDFDNARKLRNAGIGCFAGGLGLCILGSVLINTSYYYTYDYYSYGSWYNNLPQGIAGSILTTIGSMATIAGIVMWPVGQTKMNKIRRFNPNGFSLFENEKMQLNLALGGNVAGLKLNF